MMLTSCASSRAIKTEIVEVPVEVRVPLPSELTADVPPPARPPLACKDAAGRATLCNSDMAYWLNAYDAALARIRANMAQIRGLQPSVHAQPAGGE